MGSDFIESLDKVGLVEAAQNELSEESSSLAIRPFAALRARSVLDATGEDTAHQAWLKMNHCQRENTLICAGLSEHTQRV